ncbi:MAG: BlaI/MecI/CopY family transcriptional regulator [Pontiellaceae bacterium]|nr:BlaI/MecI/CopY family transcriptional regulator [Pontiellaceae bacterium]
MVNSSLGQLELDVLKIIWDKQECTVPEAAEILSEKRDYAKTTILTVIQRLYKKGFLTRVKRGGIFHYLPTQKKEVVLGNLAQQFIKSTFDGSLPGLVQNLTQTNLSAKELAELRSIIDQAIQEEESNS